MLADFRREYRLPALAVAELPQWEFDALLAGLSSDAVFRSLSRERAKVVTSAAEVDAITRRAMR